MINKVSEEWSQVNGGLEGMSQPESEDLERILGQVRGVRSVLKRMCDVSVTRTSLKSAVREALLPIIREHRDELFPEIVELRERLAASDGGKESLESMRDLADIGEASGEATREFRDRLAGFESRIERLAEMESRIRSDVSQLDERVTAQSDAQRRNLDGIQEELRGGVRSVEEKVRQVEESLGQLEESVPETARGAAGEVEQRLRKEIETMMEQLSGKLTEFEEVLRRIEELVPRREALESIERRLAGLESTFESVAGRVESIDSLTPDLRGLGEKLANVREEVREIGAGLDRTTEGVSGAREALGGRLDELQRVLEAGIERWDSDQSRVLERLTTFRDSLRDQVLALGQQMSTAQKGLWGKITKKDPALKLSANDIDDLSGKLEGIISGLEAVIARKQERS